MNPWNRGKGDWLVFYTDTEGGDYEFYHRDSNFETAYRIYKTICETKPYVFIVEVFDACDSVIKKQITK